MTMHTSAWPETVEVSPGANGHISVSITNTSTVIDAYRVQVFGLDPTWITVEPARLSLFPGDTANVEIFVKLPPDYPASRRTLAVNVVSDDDPGEFVLTEIELAVAPQTRTTVQVDPIMVTGGRRATFGLIVSNEGNAAVVATGFAVDPEDLAEFTFEPARVIVPPGREQIIQVTAQGGRAWFGQQRARTFTMGVDAENRIEALGTFVQRPRIGRWLLSLLGLLTAAAVFAAVLSRSFDSVVDEAKLSTGLVDAALNSNQAGGAVVPTNPGSVSGLLTSSTTGQGFSGAQAELFVVGDGTVPVASAASDASGAFTFANLGSGSYKLRLSGSGVGELWYGDVATFGDATEIAVQLGELTTLEPITIGGIPVAVEGAIDVADPTGVTVTLIVPGQIDPNSPAVIASAEVGPDGSFSLPDVPSPGTYQMIVSKPGFAPSVRDVVLEPGQPLGDLAVTLQPGNGIITGSVSGPSGPLGGATVVASDGTTEIQTVSLTEGTVGSFSLRNLATPGQYTVTITRDGFAPEARTISLDETQRSADFSARLVPANGSVQGRALIEGAPARGLKVALSGGTTTRTTAVVSQGPAAGQYAFYGLTAPGTYTLTFTGPDVIPQVRVIDLDPYSGSQDASGVDVSLSPERTTIQGIVRDVDGSGAAQAKVTLSDGADEITMLSADDPVGRFEFSNIAPGAYTMTASRVGTEPVVVLVNVTAGAPVNPLDLRLGQQAGLSGEITGFDPLIKQATVKLFDPTLFPVIPLDGGVTTTDSSGRYSFPGLVAPASYVVAVYASPISADPLDSIVVVTQPGAMTTIPTFTVRIP